MNNLTELINGIILIFKNFLRKIKDQKYYKLYPINPKHDDVYIVEYPRSGITWLSTLIANVNLLTSNKNIQITLYNLHQYIPDIHTSLELNCEPSWSIPKYRFIKSHDVYNRKYNFIIYIIRDPYRVMVSYYLFIKQLIGFKGTFDEFVRSPQYGIKAWLKHISSWLEKGPSNQKIHLIRYEDLMKQPFEEIKKIYENLGILIDENDIRKSIDKSNLRNMKMTEEMHKIKNPNYSEFRFIGNGQDSYKTVMTQKSREYIYENIKENNIYKKFYINNNLNI
jgi:hypothetical protein